MNFLERFIFLFFVIGVYYQILFFQLAAMLNSFVFFIFELNHVNHLIFFKSTLAPYPIFPHSFGYRLYHY